MSQLTGKSDTYPTRNFATLGPFMLLLSAFTRKMGLIPILPVARQFGLYHIL